MFSKLIINELKHATAVLLAAGSILTSCMEKNGRAEREKLPRGQHTLRRVIMLIFHYRVPRRTAQPSADRRIHEYDYT